MQKFSIIITKKNGALYFVNVNCCSSCRFFAFIHFLRAIIFFQCILLHIIINVHSLTIFSVLLVEQLLLCFFFDLNQTKTKTKYVLLQHLSLKTITNSKQFIDHPPNVRPWIERTVFPWLITIEHTKYIFVWLSNSVAFFYCGYFHEQFVFHYTHLHTWHLTFFIQVDCYLMIATQRITIRLPKYMTCGTLIGHFDGHFILLHFLSSVYKWPSIITDGIIDSSPNFGTTISDSKIQWWWQKSRKFWL